MELQDINCPTLYTYGFYSAKSSAVYEIMVEVYAAFNFKISAVTFLRNIILLVEYRKIKLGGINLRKTGVNQPNQVLMREFRAVSF